MNPIPRTDEAMKFLRKWRMDGPWVLTAISSSNDGIATKTFTIESLEEMQAWIENYNGKRNLYFTINEVSGNFDSKPSRLDVVTISVLQIDADPRIGENVEEEQKRILKRLQKFVPHPSAIIFSGGGYQAYWFLETPILLDGTEATAIDAESYSVQLELLLDADRCSNCDRIFRLPGTINLPNEVKKKKGRVAALASVVEWIGTRYPLTAFTKAPTKIQPKHTPTGDDNLAGGGERIKISGNIALLYIEDLIKKNIIIPDPVKVLIVQGTDPDNPSKYPSRSEPLFAVCCALARAGADDDIIAGIILNRDNAISHSVLDKPRPERYAAKQIQDAREEVHDPMLRELNGKHAVISDIGGKCRIISEVFEYSLNRARISYQSFQDFTNRYMNRRVQVATDKEGQPVMKPAGKWWVDHVQRRQYETIVFSPGQEVVNAYNLWQGFACDSIPGDCSFYIEHIRQNICRGDEGYYNYIISWMARCVQQPDCPGEVAIVLRGEMGTGKGAFCKHFGSLFGRHFLQVSDSKHLVGSFNAHLRDCVVIFGDEAFFAGDKKHESVLKSLVTEPYLTIEAKGVDVIMAPNYTHVILASNSQWVVPAGSNERRYFALDVGEEKMQDKKYFAAIQKQINEGGREALLHHLLNHNIKDFEVRDVPNTEALKDQKLLSMGHEEAWWYEKLQDGRILRDDEAWEREIQKAELQDDYIFYMQRVGVMRKSSPTVLGKFLGRVCPGGMPKSYQKVARVKQTGSHGEEYTVSRRVYFYEIPELGKCREHWDKHHGGPFLWQPALEKTEQQELRPPEAVFA